MLAEEGKRNWVLVAAIVIVILFVGGVIASFLTAPALEPPGEIKAELENGSVLLTWKASPNVEGYRVYRALVGERPQLIAELLSEGAYLTYRDRSVEEGKEYVYYITSFKGVEESVRSPPIHVYVEPFPPYNVQLKVLDACGGDGKVVVAFSAENAEGCSFSFDAKNWKDFPLESSPVALRAPAYLSEGGESYLYMKCYRSVDGKRVESDVVRAVVKGDTTPPQLYGDVEVEEGRVHIRVESDEPIEGCVAFAGPQLLGEFEEEATFPLPPGDYLLTISCRDGCGNANFLVVPVENNRMEVEVNNTTYRLALAINGDAPTTSSPNVVLNIVSENFQECRFANEEDAAEGLWTPWERARDEWERPWTLSACDGLKRVYMECRDGPISYTVKDAIYCSGNTTEGAVSATALGVVDKYILSPSSAQLAGEEPSKVSMPSCSATRPNIKVVSATSPYVTKTGDVILLFSSPVDYVEVFSNNRKVAEGKVENNRFSLKALALPTPGDVELTYHWKAYVGEENRTLAGEGDVSILWDRTPPEAGVECGDVLSLTPSEPLQLALVSFSGDETVYCWKEEVAGRGAFLPPLKGSAKVKVELVDRAGIKADTSTSCDFSAPRYDFLPMGMGEVCVPAGREVVCSKEYIPHMSATLQGRVVFPEEVEGILEGLEGLPEGCQSLPSVVEGTFTAKVDEGEVGRHAITFTPCDGGEVKGEAVEKEVLIDRKPPLIQSVSCDGGVCSAKVEDDSGVAAYLVELCGYEEGAPPEEEGWCDGGFTTTFATASSTFTLPPTKSGSWVKGRLTAYDGVGNRAQKEFSILSAAPTAELEVAGYIEEHALAFSPDPEVPGRLVPDPVLVKRSRSEELSRSPLVLINAVVTNTAFYRLVAYSSGKAGVDTGWQKAPVADTLELPTASAPWTVELHVRSPSGEEAVAEDTIVLDVDPPSLSLACQLGEDNLSVECDYAAFEGLLSSGVAHVDAALLAEGEVVETRTLSESVGRFSFPLSPELDGKKLTVYAMAEDKAGNYAVEKEALGLYVFPRLDVVVEEASFVKPTTAPLAEPDEVVSYLPVEAVRSLDGVFLMVDARGAEECGVCLTPLIGGDCTPEKWYPYTEPFLLPADAVLPDGEGHYTTTVVCRGTDVLGNEVYSNPYEASITVDATPPGVKVEASVLAVEPFAPTIEGEDLLSPPTVPLGGMWGGVFLSSVLFNQCPDPDVLECGIYGGDDGGGGGGGGGCPYPACPSTGVAVDELQPLYSGGEVVAYYGGVVETVAPAQYSDGEGVECTVYITTSEGYASLDVCTASAGESNACCAGSTATTVQHIQYTTTVPLGAIGAVCSRTGSDSVEVVMETSRLIPYSGWESANHSLGEVACPSEGGDEVYATNRLEIRTSDSFGVRRVSIYRRAGELSPTNTIVPIQDYIWVASFPEPSSAVVYEDRVIYTSSTTTATKGDIFYQYKVVAVDRAGNTATAYTEWIAPYSPSEEPPV